MHRIFHFLLHYGILSQTEILSTQQRLHSFFFPEGSPDFDKIMLDFRLLDQDRIIEFWLYPLLYDTTESDEEKEKFVKTLLGTLCFCIQKHRENYSCKEGCTGSCILFHDVIERLLPMWRTPKGRKDFEEYKRFCRELEVKGWGGTSTSTDMNGSVSNDQTSVSDAGKSTPDGNVENLNKNSTATNDDPTMMKANSTSTDGNTMPSYSGASTRTVQPSTYNWPDFGSTSSQNIQSANTATNNGYGNPVNPSQNTYSIPSLFGGIPPGFIPVSQATSSASGSGVAGYGLFGSTSGDNVDRNDITGYNSNRSTGESVHFGMSNLRGDSTQPDDSDWTTDWENTSQNTDPESPDSNRTVTPPGCDTEVNSPPPPPETQTQLDNDTNIPALKISNNPSSTSSVLNNLDANATGTTPENQPESDVRDLRDSNLKKTEEGEKSAGGSSTDYLAVPAPPHTPIRDRHTGTYRRAPYSRRERTDTSARRVSLELEAAREKRSRRKMSLNDED